ncbi:MAG: ABC transporter permease [Alphaproteobacteria bacterium]|nr:ABC transporter permease [Alphaproteobacteria bacterium]
MSPRAWRRTGYVYIAAFLCFMAAPLFFILVNSFNDAAYSVFPPPALSLRWYHNLFTVTEFWLALRNSLIIALVSAALALMLGMGVALALVRGGWAQREVIQSLFLSPLLVPRVVIGVAVFMAAIRAALYPSLTSTILAHTVLLLPYVTSILVANLLQVRRVQEEAAMDLGANAWQTFRLATVPQISKGFLVAAIFAFIVSFDEFDIALFLSRSENMTLPVRMYLYMQEQENPTMAAMSTLLIGLMVLLVITITRMSRGTNLLSILMRRGH